MMDKQYSCHPAMNWTGNVLIGGTPKWDVGREIDNGSQRRASLYRVGIAVRERLFLRVSKPRRVGLPFARGQRQFGELAGREAVEPSFLVMGGFGGD